MAWSNDSFLLEVMTTFLFRPHKHVTSVNVNVTRLSTHSYFEVHLALGPQVGHIWNSVDSGCPSTEDISMVHLCTWLAHPHACIPSLHMAASYAHRPFV